MKNMLRKTITTLAAFCCFFVFGCVVCSADTIASGICGSDGDNVTVTWTLTGTESDMTLTISGKGQMQNYYYQSIPWYNKVGAIRRAIIEDGVTNICDYAFIECSSLTSVSIPNSVTSIGDCAFHGCINLKNVVIPDNVTSIGEFAFHDCRSLKTITIPNGVTSISRGIFNGCYSLTSITIPDRVTSIDSDAFSGCTSLKSITIPDCVTSIGGGAFSGCTSLKSITIPGGITSISPETFQNCTSLENVIIPNGVTSIGYQAFLGCASLTYISIPNGVTSISNNVFRDCSSLDNITIPDAVTSIGSYAFCGCSSLTSINIPNSMTSIGAHVFDESQLKYVFYKGSQSEWKKLNASVGSAIVHYNSAGHSWENFYTVDVPACTGRGSESIHCSVCDAIKEDSKRALAKESHKYGAWTIVKNATCVENGLKKRVCSVCGDKATETILKHACVWNEGVVTKKATATKEGTKSYTCNICGRVRTKTIPVVSSRDNIPPEITGVSFTHSLTTPDVLKLTYSIVEEGVGANRTSFVFTCSDKKKTYRITLKDSKTRFSGTHVVSVPVASSQRSGSYQLTRAYTSDANGNTSSLDLGPAGLDNYIIDKGNTTLEVKDEFVADYETSLSNPRLVSIIEGLKDDGVVWIHYDKNNGIAAKALFDKLAGTNKIAVFDNDGYRWIVKGKDITGTTKDIDLRVTAKKDNASNYGMMSEPVVVLKFANNGKLPGVFTVRAKVRYLLGEKARVYYLKGTDLVLEKGYASGYSSGKEDWCTVQVRHNSTFLLSNKKLKKDTRQGAALREGASASAAHKAITSMKNDKDPKGTVFSRLTLNSPKQTKASIKLKWKKVSKAKKYVIYGNKCGKKNKPKKLVTVTGSTKTFKKVADKKLKKGTYYKFIIVALDKNNKVVSTSKLIHVATKGGKVGNHKSVTVKKTVLAKARKLKKGKSLKLNAKMVPQSKKLKVKKHVGLRYESTNKKIATVSSKGVVKAKKKGTCYVYAYAQNGVFKKVKVIVK